MAGGVDAAGEERASRVVVTGDVTIDWNVAREPIARRGAVEARASWQRGGAALLADLVAAIVDGPEPGARDWRISAVRAPAAPIPPGEDDLNHSYAIWSRFRRAAADAGSGSVWRVASFLGVDRAHTDAALRAEWERLEEELPGADLLVLDDAALGFRDLSDPGLWHRAFADHGPWVLLKQARPVAQGPLWEHLLAEAADRMIVVLKVDDLRGREVQVSRALSWERTAQDAFREMVFNPSVNALSRVAHTVVSFGPAGAVLVSAPADPSGAPSCTLFFDPERTEGTWEAEHPGRTMGGTNCLAAALAREILLDAREPKIDRGIQAGVAAARRLHEEGFREHGLGRMELGFPLAAVLEEIRAGREPLERVRVPDREDSGPRWAILQERCGAAGRPTAADLAATAAEIVEAGPEKVLAGVPLGRFGQLETADRSEIEAFRSLGALIGEFVEHPGSKPLSVGVFGPPGAGKSFGVREVARSVAPDALTREPLEFNLAQLRSPDELADAFHLVRDECLSGRIPLVFWDEFDTTLQGEPLGWLRYFLAPMEDGVFRQGQRTHPIGRAIFVFAGGTCARVEDFVEQMQTEAGRRAKGPDFVSRLKGYVNVLGPNPHGEEDPYHVIRRAILLRSMLRRAAPWLFDGGRLRIDRGVLRAFLETERYRHGARSLGAIAAMSRLSGTETYERSCLPPEPQLDLHVDAADFLRLVYQPALDEDQQEVLARAAHRVYCEGVRQRGETTGSLVPYEDLDEVGKEQNRRNVRDIPAKLERVGCVRVPAEAGAPPFAFTNAEVELLAREEHERWMRDLGPGWRHGAHTYRDRKIHSAYLPWDSLPEEQRRKDRDLVREIPTILDRAGYAAARTRAPAVAIGVTGHRVLGEVERIRAGLDEMVRRLEAAFPGPWTVVTALSEGADRLVAERLLAREGTRLVAVLPLPRDDYERDFATEWSRGEFAGLLDLADEVVTVPPQAGREEAYEAAGRAVLVRADALVAVWDGRDAQGRGGTGGIVAEARTRGLPLAWVHAGNRRPGTTEPTTLGGEQGRVTFERMQGPDADAPGPTGAETRAEATGS